MDICVINTPDGFKPFDDSDHEKKKRLKLWGVYKVKVTLFRNYAFHKKYFKLVTLAWEFLNEQSQRFFGSKESFRKTVEVAAGNVERVYNTSMKAWVETPKSISFDSMEEEEFAELYDSVKDVLLRMFIGREREDEFLNILINF